MQSNEKENKMNDQTLATLINDLQAPLIVSDILTGQDKDEATHYALSALISDMQPDTAILAIALSMRNIISPYLQASPSLQVTEIECNRLIEDYAQTRAHNALETVTDPAITIDLLEDAIDDLDYMQELLELNINFLSAKDEAAEKLCHLLKAQTNSQKMIAAQALQIIESGQTERPKATTTNNIVAFPAQ